MKRIGIYGGSFDPIHSAHITIALKSLEIAQLDEVLFIPAKKNPHKENAPIASDQQRVEMIQLGIAPYPQFKIETLELTRETPSYTYETLETLKLRNPEDILFLIIGGDSAQSFFSWKNPHEILSRIDKVIVYPRGNATIPPPLLPYVMIINSEQMDISSTTARIESSLEHIPEKVREYIKINNLY